MFSEFEFVHFESGLFCLYFYLNLLLIVRGYGHAFVDKYHQRALIVFDFYFVKELNSAGSCSNP